MTSPVRLSAEVQAARTRGTPIVALESSVLAQGLPIPANRTAANRMTGAVRHSGACPAVAAIVSGVPQLGLDGDDLERFLAREGVRKVSARDLGVAVVTGGDGATTVAGTLAIASQADVDVFSTGGIGGVHRETAYDESADLIELSRTSMVVVCAGAKSILDLPATLERLDTLGVPVIGYRCDELPGFFTVSTGLPLTARLDSVEDIARAFLAHRALGRESAMLVVVPPPAELALDAQTVDGAVQEALTAARQQKVRGPSVTPFLLTAIEKATDGRSLVTNLALLEANALLAGEIAMALSGHRDGAPGARRNL